MNQWHGIENSGNHPNRTADRKPNEKNESNTRDLWDNMKQSNVCILEIPEGEEKEKWIENIFEEMAENFPNLKDTDIKIQEAQRVPKKLNLKRPTPRHIIIKMAKVKERILKAKVKDKERILKAARDNQSINDKGPPIRCFLYRKSTGQEGVARYI